METNKDFWKDWIVNDFMAFEEEEKLRYAKEETIYKEKHRTVKLEKLTNELRALNYKAYIAEQRDRRRIAKEIDDLFGQKLVILGLKLGALAKVSPELSEPVNEIQGLVRQLSNHTRTVTTELCSTVLYDIGLGAAVAELLAETQAKYGIECRFSDDGEIKSLNDDISGFLFACVRELVRNVIKHAQAEHISVHLSGHDNVAYISLEDDGYGFDTRVLNNGHRPPGIGMISIREHLRYLGGEIEVTSELCMGTRVTISCPLKKEK